MTQPSPRSLTHRFKIWTTCLILVLLSQAPAFADHVHHLYYNNSTWQDQDLTELTNGGISYGSGITAFYTTPNQQFHVFYYDNNGAHVHQLYYNGSSWSDQDLTALVGGIGGYGPGGISGFSIGNYQYVFYVADDQHVHELSYIDSWTDQDITAQGNGVLANPVIIAFPTKPNNQFHVYYQDSNATDLHQLYFNGSSWSDDNLTTLTGAYCPGGQWWAGLAAGNVQHIVCPGYGGYSNNLDLLHIYYNNISWVYEDITYKVGGLPIFPDSADAVFGVNSTQGEVYGITDDGHIHQYTDQKGKWSDLDLTFDENAPAKTYGGITAFLTPPNKQYHIYLAPDNDIYQLYFNGTSWSVENLTGGAGQADYYADMAGFAISNTQHVFYFDTNF